MFVCACAYVCRHWYRGVHRRQRADVRVSPSTVWVLETELRLSDLVASVYLLRWLAASSILSLWHCTCQASTLPLDCIPSPLRSFKGRVQGPQIPLAEFGVGFVDVIVYLFACFNGVSLA